MKTLAPLSALTAVTLLTGCMSEDEKEKLEQAGADLNKLANQIIVTAPAADSVVSDAEVIVRADIPSDVEAQSVTLLVDGVEVGVDDDGAPWEINWPAYYWGDGNNHSLLLKTVSGTGVELRNEPMSVTVTQAVNTSLQLTSGSSSTSYTFGDSTTLTFSPIINAKHYEFEVSGNVVQSAKPEVTLDSLSVGSHKIKYRAVLANASRETFTGPYSHITNIQVQAPYNVEQLAITSSNGSLILKDADSIMLNLVTVVGAVSYEVEVDGVVSSHQANTVALTDLTVGSHIVRYRALFSDNKAGDYIGVFSSPVLVIVEQPDVPAELQANAAYVDDGYQLTLSWGAMDNTQSYEVELTDSEGRPTIYTSETNQLQISDLVLGEYKWKVRRINSAQQASEYTLQESVNVGVFKIQLGGSGKDKAKRIISSVKGGYLILASTNSTELSSNLKGEDDWLIRLNDQGEKIDAKVIINLGESYFDNIHEDDDGTIYLIGGDDVSGNAVITKLSSDFEVLWETKYRPEDILNNYSFQNIVISKGSILVSANHYDRNGESVRLHSFDFYGNHNSQRIVEDYDGIRLRSISNISISENDEITLFGFSRLASASGPFSDDDGGAFVLRVNKEWKKEMFWNDVGQVRYGSVADCKEIKDWGYILTGPSRSDGSVVITSVGRDGSESASYTGVSQSESFETSRVVFSDGNAVILLHDRSSSGISRKLQAFDKDMFKTKQKTLSQAELIVGEDIISDVRESIVILSTNISVNNHDILVERVSY